MFKNKVVAPLVIFIMVVVLGIIISNGYFGLQGQQNRLDADPTVAPDLPNLPGVPDIKVETTTEDVVVETTVGKD